MAQKKVKKVEPEEDLQEIINENTNENPEKKRPRGRPKKQLPKSNIVNEDKKSVTMSQGNNQYNNGNNAQQYTIDGLNDKFNAMLRRYNNVNPQAMMGVLNQAVNMLANPFIQNARIKQANAQARKTSKEELEKALADPMNNELLLQQISFGLYYTNYFYNQMVKIDRNTPLYKWYAIPEYITEKDIQSEDFKKESIRVDKIIKAFKPKLTFKTIATQVIIEGKSSYLPRYSMKSDGNIDFFVMQKLNTDMIKYTGFGSEQKFIVSFNMMIFLNPTMYNVEQYPPFIREVWNKMINCGMIKEDEKGKKYLNPDINSNVNNLPGNGVLEWKDKVWIYWVQLPQDLGYTFYTDGSSPLALPDTISLFDDFNTLDDYKTLQQSLLSKGINSIMTAEVPLIGSANLKAGADQSAISPDTVIGHADLFSNTISQNMSFFPAPFQNFKVHDVNSQPEALEIVYERNRDLLATTGNAALISTDSKPSLASVITARLLQEAKVDYLTKQFEEFLNNMLEKEFGLKYHWKVRLFAGIFKRDDEISQTIQAINNGYEGLIPRLLALFDYTLEDYRASKLYLDTLDIKPYKSFEIEKMKLQSELNLKQINTQAQIDIVEDSNTEQKKRGRPLKRDDEISDGTEVARNSGQDSEMKVANTYSSKFSVNNVCAKCGKPLTQDEVFICSECFEELKEEYGEE